MNEFKTDFRVIDVHTSKNYCFTVNKKTVVIDRILNSHNLTVTIVCTWVYFQT